MVRRVFFKSWLRSADEVFGQNARFVDWCPLKLNAPWLILIATFGVGFFCSAFCPMMRSDDVGTALKDTLKVELTFWASASTFGDSWVSYFFWDWESWLGWLYSFMICRSLTGVVSRTIYFCFNGLKFIWWVFSTLCFAFGSRNDTCALGLILLTGLEDPYLLFDCILIWVVSVGI